MFGRTWNIFLGTLILQIKCRRIYSTLCQPYKGARVSKKCPSKDNKENGSAKTTRLAGVHRRNNHTNNQFKEAACVSLCLARISSPTLPSLHIRSQNKGASLLTLVSMTTATNAPLQKKKKKKKHPKNPTSQRSSFLINQSLEAGDKLTGALSDSSQAT